MKYKLFTGANGFIGRNYRNKAIAENTLLGTTANKLSFPFLKFQSEYSDIKNILKPYEVKTIIHAASIIPDSFESASYNLFIKNVSMFNNIYNYCLEASIRKLVYISSFGSVTNFEEHDLKDFYTMSKLVGEDFCSMLNAKGINTVALRIPSPYGIDSNEKSVIHKFVKQAIRNEDITLYNGGVRTQNFVHVYDVVDAIKLAEQYVGSGVFTIADKRIYSMEELAKIVVSVTDSKSKIIYAEGSSEDEKPRDSLDFSIQKATEELGFTPKVDLATGIEQLFQHYIKK